MNALGRRGAVKALGRLATPARSLVPPGLLGYEPTTPSSPRESLEADFESLEGLELRTAWHPVFDERYLGLRDELLTTLEGLGARVERRVGILAELHRWSVQGDIDLILTRWAAVYPDADCFFTGLLSQHGGFLAGMLGGGDLETLIAEARLEGDAALRHGLFRRLEERVTDQRLIRPLFHEHAYRFAQPGVEGLRLAVTAPQVRYDEILVR